MNLSCSANSKFENKILNKPHTKVQLFKIYVVFFFKSSLGCNLLEYVLSYLAGRFS